MRPHFPSVLTAAMVLFVGLVPVEAGILFDNGPPAAVDVGRVNSDAYTVYDNFTLSTSSVVEGVTWGEHDSKILRQIFYNSTDITFFNAVPSATSEIFSANLVATRTPNGTVDSAGRFGFDYSVSGLSLSLAAGTYYVGIHTLFDGGEQSTWDQGAGNSSSVPGRYQTASPPNAGAFAPTEESVFQILGTAPSDPPSDSAPDPVPEPSTLVAASILLGVFGIRRAAWRPRRKQ